MKVVRHQAVREHASVAAAAYEHDRSVVAELIAWRAIVTWYVLRQVERGCRPRARPACRKVSCPGQATLGRQDRPRRRVHLARPVGHVRDSPRARPSRAVSLAVPVVDCVAESEELARRPRCRPCPSRDRSTCSGSTLVRPDRDADRLVGLVRHLVRALLGVREEDRVPQRAVPARRRECAASAHRRARSATPPSRSRSGTGRCSARAVARRRSGRAASLRRAARLARTTRCSRRDRRRPSATRASRRLTFFMARGPSSPGSRPAARSA